MFDEKEVYQIVLAILLMTYLIAFSKLTLYNILIAFIFAFFILVPHVIAHKITAINYLANSKFKLLEWRRYWFFEDSTFKYPFPIWLVLPILVAFATLGKVLLFTIESCQIKWKPNKRIGRWYTELQEHEISNIGLAGPLTNLAFAFIAGIVFSFVSLPLIKEFAILNAWFAFFCLLPIGGLDGTKILFGGKIRWTFVFVFTIAMLILLYFINIYFTFILALILAAVIGLWFLREELPPKTHKKPVILR